MTNAIGVRSTFPPAVQPAPAGEPERAGGASTPGPATGGADRVTISDAARGQRSLAERLENKPAAERSAVIARAIELDAGTYTVRSASAAARSLADGAGGAVDGADKFESELDVSFDEQGFTISRELTGPGGRSRTRELQLSFDPDSQTISRERSVTLASGETVTLAGSATRTEDGYVAEQTFTGRDGEVKTRNVTVSYDEEAQTFSRQVTLDTDAYTLERTTQVARTEDGFKVDVALALTLAGDADEIPGDGGDDGVDAVDGGEAADGGDVVSDELDA